MKEELRMCLRAGVHAMLPLRALEALVGSRGRAAGDSRECGRRGTPREADRGFSGAYTGGFLRNRQRPRVVMAA